MAPFRIKGGIWELNGEKNNGRRTLSLTFLAEIGHRHEFKMYSFFSIFFAASGVASTSSSA